MQTKDVINIFYATNDKQAKLALVSMVSVLENTKNKVEITIMCSTLSEENINAFYSLEKYENCKIIFAKIDEKEFSSFPLPHWVTPHAWFRIKIPNLRHDIKKAIYLDCDTLLNGDIIDFWKIDIKDYLIAGVKDVWNNKQNADRLNLQDALYFNSGVLLINCKKWQEEDILNKIIDYIEQNKNKITVGDQDIINVISDNKKLQLVQKYNYLETWWHNYYTEYREKEEATYYQAKNDPLIIHFTAYKPSSIVSQHSYKDLWWEYAKKTCMYEKLLEEYKKEADKFYKDSKSKP